MDSPEPVGRFLYQGEAVVDSTMYEVEEMDSNEWAGKLRTRTLPVRSIVAKSTQHRI